MASPGAGRPPAHRLTTQPDTQVPQLPGGKCPRRSPSVGLASHGALPGGSPRWPPHGPAGVRVRVRLADTDTGEPATSSKGRVHLQTAPGGGRSLSGRDAPPERETCSGQVCRPSPAPAWTWRSPSPVPHARCPLQPWCHRTGSGRAAGLVPRAPLSPAPPPPICPVHHYR